MSISLEIHIKVSLYVLILRVCQIEQKLWISYSQMHRIKVFDFFFSSRNKRNTTTDWKESMGLLFKHSSRIFCKVFSLMLLLLPFFIVTFFFFVIRRQSALNFVVVVEPTNPPNDTWRIVSQYSSLGFYMRWNTCGNGNCFSFRLWYFFAIVALSFAIKTLVDRPHTSIVHSVIYNIYILYTIGLFFFCFTITHTVRV